VLRVGSPIVFGLMVAAFSGRALAQGPAAAPAKAAAAPAPAPAASAAAASDVVHLKNGGILRGTISELVPGQYVTIVLITGETRKIPFTEVEHAGAANEPAKANAAPAAATAAATDFPAAAAKSGEAQPFAVVHAAESRVSVTSNPTGITLFRRAASAGFNGQGTVSGYDEVCTAPCNVSMPAGTHTFAVAKPGGKPHEADAITLPAGNATMSAAVVDRTAIRIGVGLAGAAALVGGFVMIFAGSTPEDPASSGQIIGAAVLGGLGGGMMGAAFAIPDGAEITITPGTSPAPLNQAAGTASAPWFDERQPNAVALRDQLSGLTLRARF